MAIQSGITAASGVRAGGKRETILRAAIDTFARRGYFNARVTDIASEAGVADGTIYLYFESKEDLLFTIFQESMVDFLDRLREELASIESPGAKLERLVAFHLETIGSDKDLAIVFQVELRHTQKFMAKFSHGELADYFGILRQVIQDGQRAGEFRSDVDPQLAAKAIFGMIDEMVTSWILSEKEEPLATVAGPLTRIALNGLKSEE